MIINQKQRQNYQLSMADHRGKWEPTPYTGNIAKLVKMLTKDFSFTLIDF